MDKYKEQLVRKGKDPSDTTKRVLISAAGIIIASLLVYLSMRLFGMSLVLVGIILAAAALWVTYYFLGNLYIEYEYIFTSNTSACELDVDKISGQRKRKRLITVELKSVTRIGRGKEFPENASIIDASDRESEGVYFLDFRHSSLGETRLFFTPNDEMLSLIDSVVPRTAQRD